MASRKRTRGRTVGRTRARKRGRAWLLLPVIILAAMLGWLYRDEIVNLATFGFKGIDFTRPAGETPSGGRIKESERKELEKILRNQ